MTDHSGAQPVDQLGLFSSALTPWARLFAKFSGLQIADVNVQVGYKELASLLYDMASALGEPGFSPPPELVGEFSQVTDERLARAELLSKILRSKPISVGVGEEAKTFLTGRSSVKPSTDALTEVTAIKIAERYLKDLYEPEFKAIKRRDEVEERLYDEITQLNDGEIDYLLYSYDTIRNDTHPIYKTLTADIKSILTSPLKLTAKQRKTLTARQKELLKAMNVKSLRTNDFHTVRRELEGEGFERGDYPLPSYLKIGIASVKHRRSLTLALTDFCEASNLRNDEA